MGVHIASPGSNSTVSPSFLANGNDTGSSVSGVMKSGGTSVSGTTTLQPSGKDGRWTISFSNVPPGSGYTLTVTDNQGATAQSTNITVGQH